MTLLCAIDQGTSSSRFIVFSTKGEIVASAQKETSSIYPKEGWVEQDPMMILASVEECMAQALKRLKKAGKTLEQIRGVGITNQRESVVLWDAETGKPLSNAIIWLDLRTASTVHKLIDRVPNQDKFYFQPKCGLPIATYFSAVKYRWLLDHATPEMEEALRKKTLRFGTIDTWLIWNLTGGPKQGSFVTDVTNASRTMLMDLETLSWDDQLCSFFGIDKSTLPEIRSSAEVYGVIKEGLIKGVPITGCAGDQQAALVGHRCFSKGQVKNTYGTGCFMLFNTGEEYVISSHGLLTTVAYQIGASKPVYALEGSVAIAGAAVTWLRDNLKIISKSSDIGELAGKVENTGGVYFVPAFSGLFAPYWRDDARGVIVALTQKTDSRHICRAVLEGVCFQTKEVLEAMNQDSGTNVSVLKVDGGMTNSPLCMQIQADLTDIRIENPSMKEATALGAMILAGLGAGVWKSEKDISFTIPAEDFTSNISEQERRTRFAGWRRAVERSLGLGDEPDEDAGIIPSAIRRDRSKGVAGEREAGPAIEGRSFDIIPTVSGLLLASAFAFVLSRK